VDYCLRGEGEVSFREFVRLLDAGADVETTPGLSLRKNGGFQDNPEPPPIADLDDLPPVLRGATLFPERVSRAAWGSLIGSRGCPWRCTFCSSAVFWHKKFRFRSAASLVEEVRQVRRDHGTGLVTFWDDVFSVRREVTLELCRRLSEEPRSIAWKTATRANLVDEELLTAMRRAGCVQLEIGVETASPRLLQLIHKDVSLGQIEAALEMIERAGIAGGAFFMAGFPQETEEDLRQTFAFMQRIRAADVVLNVYDPQPGAPLFEEAAALGLVDPEQDWTDFPLWPDAHYCPQIPPERFDSLVREIADWCWAHNNSWPVLLRRLRPKISSVLRSDPKALLPRGWRFLRNLAGGFLRRDSDS
jgi:anaerobic magnesium-protoporphyrin IX monomethyl ester cyclase